MVDIRDWPIQPNCAPRTQVFRPDVSADGQWLALYECYDPDPILVVFNKTGTKNWHMHYLDYTNHPEDGLIGLEMWSTDSRYAYYYSTGYFDPIGCYYNHGGFGLFRLDLQTGDTSAVLPLQSEGYPYIWSFSPTDRRLLYKAADSPISFLDLKTGMITEMPPLPAHVDFGGFLWSPDGLSVAFTLMQQALDGPPTYLLNLIDVSTSSLRTLMISQPNQCLAASSWLSEDRLVVYTALNDSNEPGTEIEIDITSIP